VGRYMLMCDVGLTVFPAPGVSHAKVLFDLKIPNDGKEIVFTKYASFFLFI